MALAANLFRKAIISKPAIKSNFKVLLNATRNHWNFQYQPGQYPRTPQEREAAAKKYGLTIEEYQPYPESMGYGDYPKLPDVGEDSRDPYYPYDNPELKRNFNEPLNAKMEIFGGDRYDPALRPRFSLLHQWTWFLGVLGGSFLLYYFLEDYKFGRPVTMKQYPTNGPHYLFSDK